MSTCFDVFRGTYQPNFTWKINNIMKLLRFQAFVIRGKTTFRLLTHSNIKARPMLSMDAKGVINMWLKLSGPNSAAARVQPPLPIVYFVLKDRKGTPPLTQHAVRGVSYTAHNAFSYAVNYKRKLFAKSWFASFTHMRNDSVVLEVVVVEASMTVSRPDVHSYDGTITFLLDNYLARKMAEKRFLVERQESPYFYTAEEGFRMQVWVVLTAGGPREDGVKLGIALLSGEHDQRLTRTFSYGAAVALSRPGGDDDDHRTETQLVVEKKVVSKFISFNVPAFIHNDSLLVQVHITPA